MGRVAAAYLHLINLLKVLSGVIIFIVFILIVSDVLIRLVGLKPWLYSSVLVEYGLLWFTMLAAPWLARTKGHVFIDAITQLLPPAAQRVIAKFTYLVCVATSLAFSFYSFRLLLSAIAGHEIDTRAIDMPMWTLLAPLPPCFLMVGIEFVRFLIGIDTMYSNRTEVRDSV
jgi:TRAP-type C4-dicarboxylate transport system permease small subunit